MTALVFPLNPTLGQQYESDLGTTWTWDGVKWIVGSLAPKQYAESVVGPANITSGQLFDIILAHGAPSTNFTVSISGPLGYSYTTTGVLDSGGNYIYTGQQFTAVGTYTYTVNFAFDNATKIYTFNITSAPVVAPVVETTYDPLLGVSLPTHPSVGQLYTLPDNTIYQWTGSKWVVFSTTNSNSNPPTTTVTNPYVLPKATNTILGGVKIGDGIDNADGTISVNISEIQNLISTSAAPATPGALGQVKIGNNINVTNDGTISVPSATNNTLGVVKAGTNVNIDSFGALSVPVGAGINKVVDIPDVNSTSGNSSLNDGALLVYNASNERWDTVNNLRSDSIDGGFF